MNLCSMETKTRILRWPISRATNVDGFIHAGADSFHRAALKRDSGSCKRTQCTRIESSLFLSPHPSLIIPKESSHERDRRTIRFFFFFFFFIVVRIKIYPRKFYFYFLRDEFKENNENLLHRNLKNCRILFLKEEKSYTNSWIIEENYDQQRLRTRSKMSCSFDLWKKH